MPASADGFAVTPEARVRRARQCEQRTETNI